MMRGLAVLFLGLSGGLACAHLPTLAPVDSETAARALVSCRQAFPLLPWRATHAIHATLPFGQNSALLGAISAEAGALHVVLLSPEGLTLFEGIQRGSDNPVVERAVSPFDRPAFAPSLMADVSTAYLAPVGLPAAIGTNSKGDTTCRWSSPRGETTEVALAVNGPSSIRTFHGVRLSREIFLHGAPDRGFYPVLLLRVPGTGGYLLEMRLLDHE